MCCSVLQCAVVCCSVLQCVAVCCSVVLISRKNTCCSVLQCRAPCPRYIRGHIEGDIATHCNTLQHTATHCNTRLRIVLYKSNIATHALLARARRKALQRTSMCRNVLQRTLQCPTIRGRMPSSALGESRAASVLRCIAVQCIAVCCSVLQCVVSFPPRVHTNTRPNTESVYVKNDPQRRPIQKKRDHEIALVMDACNVKRMSLIYKLKRGGA